MKFPKLKFGDRAPKQKSVFDQAEQKKQQGIEVSFRNASSVWKDAATKRIQYLVKHRREFTSDDVVIYLDNQGIVTGNNSALGAIFQAFSRAGLIQDTGRFKESVRPSRHKAPVRIWISNAKKGSV